MKIKKCVWIPIVCILSISLLAFVGYHGLRLYASYRFYKLMTREETYHNTYDGRYGYLQLSSEQGLSCVINIYEHSEGQYTTYNELKYVVPEYFRNTDMRKIAWGNNTYDLYFDSRDVGSYVFLYTDDTWDGPCYIEKDETTCKYYYAKLDGKRIKVKDVDESTIPEGFHPEERKRNGNS